MLVMAEQEAWDIDCPVFGLEWDSRMRTRPCAMTRNTAQATMPIPQNGTSPAAAGALTANATCNLWQGKLSCWMSVTISPLKSGRNASFQPLPDLLVEPCQLFTVGQGWHRLPGSIHDAGQRSFAQSSSRDHLAHRGF